MAVLVITSTILMISPAIFPVDFSYLVTNPADQPPGYYESKEPSR